MKNYGRSITEFVDFYKDLKYAHNARHSSIGIAVALWIFALFAMLYTSLSIIFMTKQLFIENFGQKDFEDIDLTTYYNSKFLLIKFKRVLREALQFQTSEELKLPEVQKRIIRHQFFVALFENLPQFILQLYAQFANGSTFGLMETFSVVFSLIMFQWSSSALLPFMLAQLEEKMKENVKKFKVLKIVIILLTLAFPFFLGMYPFGVFFNPDRT